MNKLKLFSKPITILFFVSLLSTIYLFSIPQKNKFPKETYPEIQITPPDIQSKHSAIKNIASYNILAKIDGFFPDDPKSLPVYEASLTTININEIAQDLIGYFKLVQSNENPNLYASENKASILIIDYTQQIINYNYNPRLFPTNTKYNLDMATTYSNRFVSSINEFKNLKINPSMTQFLSLKHNDPHFDNVSSPNSANYYNLSYSFTVDGFPYYENAEYLSPLQVFVGPPNTIYKMSYKILPVPNYNNPINKNLLSYNKAITELQSGKGSIIYFNVMDAPFNSTSLSDIYITSYNIEYRYSSSKKLLIPYYRFMGYFLNQFNQESPITLILPAVEL